MKPKIQAKCIAMLTAAVTIMLPHGFAQDDDSLYRKAYGFILNEAWADAEKTFAEFLSKYSESHWADDADFWICYAKDKGRLPPEASFECYRQFLLKWPRSEWSDDARRNLVVLSKRLARDGKPEYLRRAETLVDDWEHEDSPEHEVVAMLASLGELGDARSLKVLFRYLDQAEDEHLRARLVLLLEDIEGPAVDQKLIHIIRNDTSMEVRQNAVNTLMSKEGETARAALMEVAKSQQYPLRLRTEVISNLDEWSSPATIDFLKQLVLTDPHEEIVEYALEALVDMEDEVATRALFDIFNQAKSKRMREEVLHALGNTEGPEALAFLTRMALDGKDPELSEMAVHAIQEFDENKALAALDHIISSTADWRTKVAAVYSIGDSESVEAVEILKKLIVSESNLEVRRVAVSALGSTRREEAVPLLVQLINKDPEPTVRKEAIEALGDMDEVASAREALLKLLEERIKE